MGRSFQKSFLDPFFRAMLVCLLFASTGAAQTHSVTLKTYFPAPLAAYDRLRLIPSSSADMGGTLYAVCDTAGSFYLNNDDPDVALLLFCTDNGAGSLEWNTVPGAWLPGQTAFGEKTLTLADTSFFVGIGTASPQAKLHLHNGAFLATGETGSTPVSGPGPRMMWIPAHAAFRAGAVTGSAWDDSSIGYDSLAVGFEPTASGLNSIAVGYTAQSTADASVALGFQAAASGPASLALGSGAVASGSAGTALGQASAAGDLGIAIGSMASASGYASIGIGREAASSGSSSVALGVYLNAQAQNSVVLGSGVSSVEPLTNSIPDSLIAGFNATTPILFVNQPSVGINTTTPRAALSVNGGIAAGATYAQKAAPANGMIIEGAAGIGVIDPFTPLDAAGPIRTRPVDTATRPACAASITGAIIYHDPTDTFQICTITGWKDLEFE